jgi:plasmid stability protein
MSNLTITIDEETLRRARIRALEQGTSVNALLRDYLEEPLWMTWWRCRAKRASSEAPGGFRETISTNALRTPSRTREADRAQEGRG